MTNLRAVTCAAVVALLLSGCPTAKQCTSKSDCATTQVCTNGACVPGGGGGAGGSGGTGGGSTGGGGGGSTGGGGGSTGGGAGGGSTGGSTCDSPDILTGPQPWLSTTDGGTNHYSFADTGVCIGYQSLAPDRVFQFDVPGGQQLKLGVTSTDWDTVLNLIEAPAANCGPTGLTCVDASDRNGGTGTSTETVSVRNSSASSKTYFLMVDGWSDTSAGDFTVTAELSAIPPGDTCGTAVAVTGSQTLTNQSLAGYSDDYVAGAGCAIGTLSNDRVYTVSVPPGQRLTATLTVDPATDGGQALTPTLNLVYGTTCPSTLVCIAGDSSAPIAVTWDNFGAAAQVMALVVDTSQTDPTGTFTLDVALAASPSVPAGEVCDNAAPVITAATSLPGQSFSGFANDYVSNGQTTCRYGSGPDRAYAIDIPAGQVLRATATPVNDAGLDLLLSVVEGGTQCGSGPCLAGADSTTTGQEQLTQSNRGAAAQRVYLVVDSRGAPDAGFDLDVAFASPPAGDWCETATPTISAATTLPAESLASFASDYGTSTPNAGCAFASGPDRAYAIDIPVGQRLTATATSTGDLALSVVDGAGAACSAATVVCSASADRTHASGTPLPETVLVDNDGAAPKHVNLIVDRIDQPVAGETFSLAISFAAPPAGEQCATAEPITPLSSPDAGVGVSSTLEGYVDNIRTDSASTDCNSTSNPGPDRVFTLSVGAGQRLVATVIPPVYTDPRTWDPSIYVVAAPASNCLPMNTACLAGNDSGGTGSPDTATWTNTGAAAQTVFVVVDSYTTTRPIGPFTLNVSVQ